MNKYTSFLLIALLIFAQTAQAQIQLSGRSYKGAKVSAYKYKVQHCSRYCHYIEKYGTEYDVPTNLITAVIHNESGFNPLAVSSKGAKGLMQLMDVNSQGIDPFIPEQNIKTGTKLLADLIKKYGDFSLALAAYNAGEGNVKKYGGIPPFKETQHYVTRVLNHYHRLEKKVKS
ncbi:lytic transglycosylase domain-containing protein [Vibrio cholerae]|uniref:lytic transglycosylase domain-containing protein n=1 Tax=Vibrio cholerae TaxID=666 RepID=UPI0012EB15EE|nr:lytic transglycosylase domain-containing protein [Vibrio cholerae]MCD6704285.1 lytic transglycosylase domain-containing protein [Vibrio cholerae]MDD9696480.1 lytic transglycosylase domain-containing protein [Vibrio cholerae]MDD9705346.1 lytic transglycosylase domain-containing protein [Vibrio cholerae]MEE3775432.1 lytic transglycosylase domain-containing protein [Vibrio cholerae]GIB04622.1 murein transglycosylase [Vibrio cholerae]